VVCVRDSRHKPIFRQFNEERIVVSIIPDVNASHENVGMVKAWSVIDLKMLDAKSFATIMNDVTSSALLVGCI
jgi:hypothetical protein